MKKIILLLYVFMSSLLFIESAYAEEYKLNSSGNYSIKSATCTYEYQNTMYQISFENDKILSNDLKSCTLDGKKCSDSSYYRIGSSLNINKFYKNKEFSCPTSLDVCFWDAKGYAFELGKDEYVSNIDLPSGVENLGNQCTRATLNTSKSNRKHNVKEKGEQDTPSKTTALVCQYSKETTAVGSAAQSSAPKSLKYNKYTDGTNNFTDNNGSVYNISSGSLSECSDYVYTIVEYKNKAIDSISIVDNCNFNTNNKCVKYQRANLQSNSGSTMKDDGSSDYDQEVVEPDEISELKTNISLDFDTEAGCESYLGNPKDNIHKPPAYYLQFVFNLMKYVAIIMLLVLTIADFAKATASSNQDAMKKAINNTVKRIILAIVIFLLPILIEFLFKVLGIYSSTTCGIK